MNDAQKRGRRGAPSAPVAVPHRLFVRSSVALPSAFALLALVDLSAAGFSAPTLGELAYLAALSAVHGLAIGGALLVLGCADRFTKGERRIWPALALLLVSAPFTYGLGQHAALADGLRARGFSPVLLSTLGTGLSALTLVVVWLHQRYSWRSRWVAYSAVPLLILLAWVEQRFGFTSRGLSLLLCGCAISLTAQLLTTLLLTSDARRPGLTRLVAGLGGALLLASALAVSLAGSAWREGRRRVLVRTSSLAHLDHYAGVFGERFLGHRLSGPVAGPCPAPAPLPASPLALPTGARRNVILITIDTLRSDDASAIIGRRPIMPHLTRFMAESWRAQEAYTSYPATMLALSAAFSGVMPSRSVLSGSPPPSVFGALQGHVSRVSAILPDRPYFRRPALEHMIVQGAERVVARSARAQVGATIKRLRALRKRGATHLVWLHLFEPHEPYERHAAHDFGHSARERYRSELAAIDVELGKLFRFLQAEDAYEDTLVMVFADHGESFGELGHTFHHYHLYPWLIQVPFAMRVPGQGARRFEGPVHLSDVAATVFDFVGLTPDLPLDGESLLRAGPRSDRVIVSEEFMMQSTLLADYIRAPASDAGSLGKRLHALQYSPGYVSKVSVIKRGAQLVLQPAANVHTLHRLDDRRLAHDLSSRDPDTVRELRQELARYYERASPWLGCVPGQIETAQAR